MWWYIAWPPVSTSGNLKNKDIGLCEHEPNGNSSHAQVCQPAMHYSVVF